TNNVSNAFYDFEDFSDIVSAGKINLAHKSVIEKFGSRENFEKFVSDVLDIAITNKSKILVFDSLSSLRTTFEDDREYTRSAIYISEVFKEAGLTSIFTLELNPHDDVETAGLFGTSMFDGIIKLTLNQNEGSSQYALYVPKLRNSNHRISSFPYQITSKGFDLLTN
ncbi:MAG: RAD55 family ATPase, partial [Candidatus Micrarchaeia archaeon]